MKRMVAIVLAALMMAMVGCGESVASTTASAVPTEDQSTVVTPQPFRPPEPAAESARGSTSDSAGEFTPEPISELTPEPTEDLEPDPWGMLLMTLDEAQRNEGLFLKRGDKYYCLDDVMKGDLYKTGIGYQPNNFTQTMVYVAAGSGNWPGFVTLGDIPPLVLEEGDELVVFGYPLATLRPIVETGYTVSVGMRARPDYMIICDGTGSSRIVQGSLEDHLLEVAEMDGTVVENMRDLEYGEFYHVSWFEGTQYMETVLPAFSRYYQFNQDVIRKEGELVRNSAGYALIDWSDVPAGLYCASDGGVIEIPEGLTSAG